MTIDYQQAEVRHALPTPARDVELARHRLPVAWLLAALFVLHAGMLTWIAWNSSPTVDEIVYLPAGLRVWESGHFDLAVVSPPLVRLVAAAAIVPLHPKTDWSGTRLLYADPVGRRVGEEFIRINGGDVFRLFSVARMACIPFSLVGAYVSYAWGKSLYGAVAGLLAAVLWCFCPNVLGHGALMSPDVAVAALGLAAGYSFWRWSQQPDFVSALTAGGILGLAQLAKTTAIVLWVALPLVWLFDRLADRSQKLPLGRDLPQLAVIACVAFAVLNAGYSFEGTGQRLGDFTFTSRQFAGTLGAENEKNVFRGTWWGKLPVPLPAAYIRGIDQQQTDFEVSDRPSYMAGGFQIGGWWYFYLYGLLVKLPIGTWIVLVLGAGTAWADWRARRLPREEIYLLVPLALMFVAVSAQCQWSTHFRYAIPCLPWAFVWGSRCLREGTARSRLAMTLPWGAAALTVISSLTVFPHSLSYFNEPAGGPRGGHFHLINSNIDWGQDLLNLRRWLDQHPEVTDLRLAYYGEVDPAAAGIDYTFPSHDSGQRFSAEHPPAPGWYAISVNYLRGHQWPSFDGKGNRSEIASKEFDYFLPRTPVGTAGYSIYIYRVE